MTNSRNLILKHIYNVVKPVLRGHLWGKRNMDLYDRLPLKTGSIHMKCSMTE